MAMNRLSRRGSLDRDVIRDIDGQIWTVLGHIQPKDRVIAFLKYIPAKGGRWSRDDAQYDRIFWGGAQSVTEGMGQISSKYLHDDPHFGTVLPSVPIAHIARHYMPEARLKEIAELGARDILEERALRLAEILSDSTGIDLASFGVAGSLVWRAHDLSYSDINMCVYGFDESWRLQDAYEQISEDNARVSLREETDWLAAKSRIVSRVPTLNMEDLHPLFARRRGLCLDGQCIGVTPVLRAHEAPILYLTERYEDISSDPIRTTFDVHDASYGLFLPSLYHGESGELDEIDGERASRLMIYEGAFRGLVRVEDRLEVTATLQRVMRPSGEATLYQLMVGTMTGAGREYISLL
ncbi:hypothetical protein EU538_06425 [Candidatus Thorarchaeota archaeon]|nr:MAG: hypothetical protein EU538_06425 [Candidatus Thorarchaeota archaeon]